MHLLFSVFQSFMNIYLYIAEETHDPLQKDSYQVSLEKFGHLLNWFGPLNKENNEFTILDKVQ